MVNEITIDQAARTQWNLVISASKKSEVTQWSATRNMEINERFEEVHNPNQRAISFAEETRRTFSFPMFPQSATSDPVGGHHLTREWFEGDMTKYCGHIDPVILNKIHEIWSPSDWTWYASASYFSALLDGIVEVARTSFTDGKQSAVELLAVEVASKNAIIDASDWVALGYTVTESVVIVRPWKIPLFE